MDDWNLKHLRSWFLVYWKIFSYLILPVQANYTNNDDYIFMVLKELEEIQVQGRIKYFSKLTARIILYFVWQYIIYRRQNSNPERDRHKLIWTLMTYFEHESIPYESTYLKCNLKFNVGKVSQFSKISSYNIVILL